MGKRNMEAIPIHEQDDGRQACRGGLVLMEAEEPVSGSTKDLGCV